jgi:signal transduction histidine kinase
MVWAMGREGEERKEGGGLPAFLGRAFVCLGSVLFLGMGLGMSVHKGTSVLWTLGLMASLLMVLVLMARWQVRPVTDPLNQLLGGIWSGSIEDLPGAWSAMARENRELKERAGREDRLLPGIMARLEEGVLLFGPDGALEQFNPAAQRHLGLGAPLSKGMAIEAVFSDAPGLSSIRKAYAGLGSEWRLARTARMLRVRAIPFAPLGSVSGVLLTLDDVTSQEALETTRQKFISNVSHELKTPVTAIRIAAENLQEEALPESALASAHSILRSVDRLTLLLGDLSELSRIESGALHLAPERVDLEAFLGAFVREMLAQHGGRGVSLERIQAVPPGTRILVDPLRLHQILENLVSNALKFSDPGGKVTLGVEVTEQGHAWEVRDQGPGIPEAEQGRIFERFYRAQGTKAKPGTGLGLAIVKHLCRLMGGEVTVESHPGEGAVFRVRLPAVPPDQASAGPPSR